ncbi:PAS domain-containing protein, partial [Spirosoma sp. HMF4905]
KHPTALGQPGADCWPEAWSVIQPLIEQVRTTREATWSQDQFIPIYRNGQLQEVYWTFSYSPILDETNQVRGVLAIVHETTQQVQNASRLLRQTAELAQANAELNRSNQNLQQFAYVASHDLQEPLRKILSFGYLLKDQYGPQLGEGITYLERMQAAASRMSVLIKDLLTFSRITTQQEARTPVSLTQVVTTILTDLELRIQETDALVLVETLPDIQGDRSQLEQLFQNLLSNALKFRRVDESGVALPPQIHIRAQLIEATKLPASVKPTMVAKSYHHIEVADNGIGFDEKYLDRIFQVFQRLHGRSEFTGTGIGLAICEKIVINHGGAITACSQVGQGAIFSVYLPA